MNFDIRKLIDNQDKTYQAWELNELELKMRLNALVKHGLILAAPSLAALAMYGLFYLYMDYSHRPINVFSLYLLLFAVIGGVGQFVWNDTVGQKLKKTLEATHTFLTEDVYKSGARIVNSKIFGKEIDKKIEDEYKCTYDESDKRAFVFPLQELYDHDDRHFEAEPVNFKIPFFALSTGLAVLGRPGSGKSVMINQLIKQIPGDDKQIIADVKGEFLQKHFNPDTDIIICPADLRTVRFELFELVNSNVQTAAIAEILISDDKNSNDPHWVSAARAVMEGILLYASKREMTNTQIYKTMSDPEALQTIVEDEEVKPIVAHFIRRESGGSFDEHTASIISTLVRKAKVLQYLAYLDDLKDNKKINLHQWLTNGKGGKLFLLATENLNKVFAPLYGVIISYLISQILDGDDQKKIGYYFVLDELPQLGKALGDTLEKAAAVGRSKGIKTVVAMQSNSQLQKQYGKDSAESLLDTINSIIVFGNNFGAQFVEKYLGKTTFERKNEGYSFGIDNMADRVQKPTQIVTEPVIKDAEIQRLETFEFYLKLVSNPDILKSRFEPVFYEASTVKFVENPNMTIRKLERATADMVKLVQNRFVDFIKVREKARSGEFRKVLDPIA